jgi:hypothetical protein
MAIITGQQATFFDAFGFLRIEGLFADQIEEVAEALDPVPPTIGPDRIGGHPAFAELAHDDRVVGIARSALGDGVECTGVGGDPGGCGHQWHADGAGGSRRQRQVVISLVLHPLRADCGARRVIPGTHHPQSSYAQGLHRLLGQSGELSDACGVEGDAIPATVIDADSGDVLVWDGDLIHVASNGPDRGRLLSVGFRAPPVPSGSER